MRALNGADFDYDRFIIFSRKDAVVFARASPRAHPEMVSTYKTQPQGIAPTEELEQGQQPLHRICSLE